MGQISNPLGVNGLPVSWKPITDEFVCGTGGAARGDLMSLAFSATTGRITATKAATDAALTSVFVVAEHTADAGEIIKCTTYGPTFVNGLGNTFAAGEAFFRSAATAGGADRDVPDATTVAGLRAGTVLGVRGAAASTVYPFANAVPVWVGKF